MVLGVLAAATGAASTARAQQTDCRFYKVVTDKLNAFDEPRGDAKFIEALSRDDIVCVVGDQFVGDRVWAYIVYRVLRLDQHGSVNGWAIKSSLQPASQAEVAAARSAQGPSASPSIAAAPPLAAPARPEAAPPSAEPQRPEAAPSGEAVVRFTEPITSGGFPVQGHSLEELVKGIPTYPPIAGLPEEIWHKTCSNCHKWNRQSLCVQANIYAKDPKMAFRKQHPYGGPEKIAMMNWAKNGCQ